MQKILIRAADSSRVSEAAPGDCARMGRAIKRTIEWSLLFGIACTLLACSSAPGDAGERTSASAAPGTPYWQDLEGNYPYLGASGRSVCRVRTHEFSDGSPTEFDVEEYEFDTMNEMLAGTRELEPELVAQMKAAGLTNVSGCDDARRFVAMRNAFEEDPANILKAADALRAAESALVHRLPEEPSDSQVDKIAFGYEDYAWPYSVRIQTFGVTGACSAVLIGPNALITAQHCVGTAANQFMYVDYGVNSTTNCISPGCDSFPPWSWGSSPPFVANVKVIRFPGYTNNASADLALVVASFWGSTLSWLAPANTSSSWIRMYKDVALYGDRFWLMGYGFAGNGNLGGGVSRTSNYEESIESEIAGSAYFTATIESNGIRFCHMDSGGGAISDRLFNNDVVIGLASRATFSDGATSCPSRGDTEKWTAMYGKVNWIKAELAKLNLVCNEYSGGNGTYARCW
jgi:hypothetical protein